MKKILVYALGLSVLLYLVGCQEQAEKTKSEPSVSMSSSSSAMSQKTEDKSPEEVAEAEGNHAEQVVVQVTPEGYVTSHGDHYHFYNGQVGFEALISRDLVLEDPNYVLDASHIVTDVVDGHIIKIGETYYLYLTTEEPVNLR